MLRNWWGFGRFSNPEVDLPPVPYISSFFCLLLINNQGFGKGTELSLEYFLLIGGIEVFSVNLTFNSRAELIEEGKDVACILKDGNVIAVVGYKE